MLDYISRIWECRFFWLSMVYKDLCARYRGSVLGIGWSLLRPIALTIILCVVFRKLFHCNDVWTFAPYLLSGLACWNYIVTAMQQGCQCFFMGEPYIRQYPAPIAIYPLRIALAETFHFLVALVVVLGLVWYVNGFGNLFALLSLIPTLMLLFAFVWALATLAGFANVYFQDTQHLSDVGLQIVFYATPIIYAPAFLGTGRLQWWVMHTNPVVPFLELLRRPILEGQMPSLSSYGAASLVVCLTGTLATLVCARCQRRLVFHL